MFGLESLQSLYQEAPSLLSFLIQVIVKTSAILILALSVTRLLRRASAATRHFVWTLAFMGCLLLPLSHFGLPDWRITIPRPEIQADRESQPPLPWSLTEGKKKQRPAIEQSPAQFDLDNVGETASASNSRSYSAIHDVESTNENQNAKNWPLFFLFLWTLGTGFIFAKHLLGWVRIASMARQAEIVNEPTWLFDLSELKPRFGIQRSVRLLKSDHSTMPMTWGLFRPKILLPADSSGWTAARRQLVLLHELAHIKRVDCLTQLFAQITATIYWVNPLSWLSIREMLKEREHACDDYVLSNGSRATEYADLLLDFARSMRSVRFTSFAMVGMARPSQLEGRMLAILNPNLRRTVLTRFSVILGCLTVVGFVLPLAAMKPVWKNSETQYFQTMPERQKPLPESPETSLAEKIGPELSVLKETLPRPSVTEKNANESLTVEPSPNLSTQSFKQPQDENTFVVQALIETLQDSSLEVRMQAAETLGEMRSQKAVEPLSRAIQDQQWQMRERVADALGDIRNPAAIEALSRAAEDETRQVRQTAVESLSELDDKRAVPVLIKVLDKDPEWQVRKCAADALGEIEDPRAIPVLMKTLQDDNREVRKRAIEALGEIGASEAVHPITEALKDEDWQIRKQAAWALGEIHHPLATESLAAVIDDDHPEVRKTAVWALGEIEDRRAIEPLQRALQDPEWQIRQEAAHALGDLDDTGSVSVLSNALHDPHVEVRKTVIRALAEIDDNRAVSSLTPLLNDENWEVRKYTAWALGEIADPAAVVPLLAQLKNENWELRKTVAWALGEIGDRRAIKPLTELLKDKNQEVRKEAARALGEMNWRD